MQPQDFSGFALEFLKRNVIPLLFGLCGLILFGYGLIQSFSSQQPQSDIVFESENSDSSTPSAQLVVDVAGAVEKPGVYKLAPDARVEEAISAAGGLGPQADREWVSSHINLALKLKDGTKIYIPSIEEEVKGIKSTGTTGITSITGSDSEVNINSASQSELEALPGIGQVTSQKIISGRPYSSIEELAQKKIVSQSVFEKIREKISVY